ncbi:MAG TPA: RHS repeat-associated core domain-containing protein [Polyangiaceae bacterium]|nr:RHS repeat-associated core domain-containing protein [Polyangiaceae bacterium]
MTVGPILPIRYRSPRPVEPPAPVFATTSSATANAVLSTLDQAVAPLRELPSSDDGAAGKVSKAVGGALGVINAPAMFIDAASSIGVSKLDQFISSKLGIPTLFPALPVARLGITMHMGTPHTHVHPPSTTPPAPPIPLPSFGVAFLAGSASVLVNGIPALRAGDVGIGLTCGSMAPPFEIMTGAAGVYFGGARVARLGMDITFHCNPSPASAAAAAKVAKPFMNVGKAAVAFGAMGAVAQGAGAIEAAEKGNSTAAAVQAAQMALDAAALALSMLRGKDPAGPPGVGALIGSPPTVVAGGAPMPNLGAWAQGKLFSQIGKAVRGLKNKFKRKSPAADANGTTSHVGEPVNLVTGENFNTYIDFKSYHGAFTWARYMTSAWARKPGRLGPGFRHVLESRLEIRLHRVSFHGFAGEHIEFPRFGPEQSEVTLNGYRLTRLSDTRFRLRERRLGTLEFQRPNDRTLTAALVAIQSPEARAELTYSDNGLLTEVREYSLGMLTPLAVYALSYDSAGRLLAIQGCNLQPVGDARAASGPPAWQRLAVYTYDPEGHLISAEDPFGARESYVFDKRHRLIRATDRGGYSFGWSYDIEDRCVSSAGQDGLWSVQIEYAPEARQTRVTFHHGGVLVAHYDEDGVITKIIDANGATLDRLRAEDGRILEEVDSAGRRMVFLYDADGANIGRVGPFGHRYLPELDEPVLGNPFERLVPDNARDRTLGTDRARELGLGQVLASLPAELSQLAQRVFELGTSTPFEDELRTEHDSYGRRTLEIDALGRSRKWSYDAAGNEVMRSDREGRLYQQRFTSFRLLAERVDPLGHSTSYSYDPHGRLTRITDPLGTTTEYAYDKRDRLVRVTRLGSVREEYVRDKHGLVLEKRGKGSTPLLRITPHANCLPQTIELSDGKRLSFDYDARGQVTVASSVEHEVTQAWDWRRRLVHASCDGREIEHAYDGPRQRETRIARKFSITHSRPAGPNSAGTVDVRITGPNGFTWHLQRGQRGMVLLRHGDSADATQELQQYSLEGQLRARLVWHPARLRQSSPSASWSARYEYSPEGDLLAIRDSLHGDRRFEVDAAHRLVAEVDSSGRRLSYPLDEAGTLLSKPELPLVRIAPGNRLQHAGLESFEYDDRDRLCARWTRTRRTRYEYNSLDQLVAAYRDEEPEPWTATYDGLGRRISCGIGDRRTIFWWDNDRLAAETLPDLTFRIYIYADDTAFAPIGFVDYASVEAAPESGRAHSVFADQVGLPLLIQDAQGRVVWHTDDTDPYGQIDVAADSTVAYNLRWPGHYFDPDTGLHYNRFRYYDPKLGRYLQSDPAGCAGGINLYAYPSNPLIAVDVLGLTPNKTVSDADAPPAHLKTTEAAPAPEPTPPPKKGPSPLHGQEESHSCAIASARMVIEQKTGKDHGEGTLRNQSSADSNGYVPRRGTHLDNVERLLHNNGVPEAQMKGGQSISDLQAATASGDPAIVAIVHPDGSGGHAMVCDGVIDNPDGSRSIVLRDPAPQGSGTSTTMSESDFNKMGYSGWVITTN